MKALPAERLVLLGRELRARRHRSLVWVQGEQDWCHQQLKQLLAVLALPLDKGRLITDRDDPELNVLRARDSGQLLGQTLLWIGYDAYAGFNPNSIGQVAGCIGAGGWLILLTPPAADWRHFPDPEYRQLCVEPWTPDQLVPHFLDRLIRLLAQDRGALWSVQTSVGVELREPVWPEPAHPDSTIPPAPPWLSLDQQRVVAEIVQSWQRRPEALVLTADRGRGKTAALGLALLAWAAAAPGRTRRALVTAPTFSALEALFERLQQAEGGLIREGNRWRTANLELGWYSPDELLEQSPAADLLLIDEAAAIATPVLAGLSRHYRRILFATTQHGYEGNGRGFTLRFLSELDRLVGGHRLLTMQTPVRWAPGDPLEALVNRLLLLDAEPTDPSPEPAVLRVERLERAQLVADEVLLRRLFGLLILAHYRTTPGDLRVLLDSPNLHLWCLWRGEQLVGCALIAEEGGLSDALTEGVWQGVRRPTGHLLPQALIAHEGWREVAPLRAWRIVRIALHPALQQHQLGSQLLQAIAEQAQREGVDYLGASFAATEGLLRYWRCNGFVPVRVGDQHDPVSASHAVVVVRVMSSAARQWCERVRPLYGRRLRYRLSGALSRLPVALLPELLVGLPVPPLDQEQQMALVGFAQYNRSLESTLLELDQLIALTLPRWPQIRMQEVNAALLINRVWRQQSSEQVSEPAGRRAQLARLRALTGQLLEAIPVP